MKKKIYKWLSVEFALLSAISLTAFSQSYYTLSQCKDLAIKNNSKIKNSILEIHSAEETKSAAFTKYFPNVSANLMGFYAADYLVKMDWKGGNLPVYDGNPANLLHPTQFAYMPDTKIEMLDKFYVGNITFVQPLFAGGKISAGNNLAELNTAINKEKLNIEKYSVWLKTEELYWKLVTLRQQLVSIDIYIDFLNNLSKDVNVSYSSGLIDKSDVLKVSMKQSELNINKVKLQNGLDMVREALCQHIGINNDMNLNPADTNMDVPEPNTFYIEPKAAVQNRFEMNLLNKAVEAEELQTDLKRGDYLPEVGVGAMLTGLNILNKTNYNAIVFGSVKVPISDWWEASHSLEEHKIREDIARNNLKENNELIILQISQAWKSLVEAYNNIGLGNKMLDQANEHYKIVESNYKAGVISLSDFLEAKATLQKAQVQLIEFKADYRFAIARYQQAVGKY